MSEKKKKKEKNNTTESFELKTTIREIGRNKKYSLQAVIMSALARLIPRPPESSGNASRREDISTRPQQISPRFVPNLSVGEQTDVLQRYRCLSIVKISGFITESLDCFLYKKMVWLIKKQYTRKRLFHTQNNYDYPVTAVARETL